MSTLIEDAQRHVERVTQELSGDDDFLPFMTIRDPQDRVIIAGLMMPQESARKDELADIMTALCMVHRGVEAAFASTTWMVWCDKTGRLPDVAPSQHPDRVEQVCLLAMNTEGEVTTHFAPIVRENNMVGVGLWSDNRVEASGRFADAMRMGLAMGQRMPPELIAYIDEATDADLLGELVNKTARLIGETRAEAEASRN